MAEIQTLLSTLPAVGLAGRTAAPTVTGASVGHEASNPQRTELAGDTFAQGQWWKNRSQSTADDGASGGDWRARAAIRAYGAQQVNGSGVGDASGAAEVVTGAVGERPVGNDLSAAGEVAEEVAGGESSETAESVADDENTTPGKGELTPEEHQVLTELKIVDRQVRSHEQAHLAAAGGYATSGASFQYQNGPDGKRYAVGGEVQIDVSKEADPEQTLRKMSVVRSAALAPANPSSQDRSVAAAATAGIVDAQRELQAMRTEEAEARRDDLAQQGASEETRAGAVASRDDAEGQVAGNRRLGVLRYEASAVAAGIGGTAEKNRPGINLAV